MFMEQIWLSPFLNSNIREYVSYIFDHDRIFIKLEYRANSSCENACGIYVFLLLRGLSGTITFVCALS